MKIVGYEPYSVVDWPGKTCSVIFLGGCNFRCPWCHNPNVVNCKTEKEYDMDEILRHMNRNRAFYDGICITGGEPTIHRELPELINKCHKEGWKVKLDTNGSNLGAMIYFSWDGLVEYLALDIKGLPKTYLDIATTDIASFGTLGLFTQKVKDVPGEVRMTLVPGVHTLEDFERLCRVFLKDLKCTFYLQNFSNMGKHLDPKYDNIKPFSIKEIESFKYVAEKYINHVGVRNVANSN